ncbi:hypothetical protein [Polaromonas sp. CF318]|uniref:hypothetical protein n=1 Tax=Polaromonas sp. CF318 TaxID=1144318 RepID=UPI0002D33948|nr:hypothetical protein [Polaromonas sp. CF318]
MAASLGFAGMAHAQSFCSSDGQGRPMALLERFINANCDSCWSDSATPQVAAGQAVIDWVVPGDKGDDAPLSAVAAREALDRLAALRQSPPAQTLASTLPVRGLKGATLRVAHGLPLSGYLGTSIELKPIPTAAKGRQWTAWLALVETLPAGTEGSPVERNLVRNVIQVPWDGRKPPAKGAPNRFFDARSMSIAQGANPERMRVLGWVEDDKGRVLAAAQSRCTS